MNKKSDTHHTETTVKETGRSVISAQSTVRIKATSLWRIMSVISPLLALIIIVANSADARAQGLFGGSKSGRTLVALKTGQRTGTIIVSFADRRIYKVLDKQRAISYPIAIPKGGASWSGNLPVSRKTVNPSWTPTARMRRENPKLPAYVPGGHPRNPLGVRALYLGSTLYRIHGTDAPWLIGDSVSSGCIRMYNKDVIDLYDRTPIGTRVVVNSKQYTTTSFASQSRSKVTFDPFASN